MSARAKNQKPQLKMKKARYYFFLNPYKDAASTRCPKCEGKTRVRKYCLAIHIEPRFFLTLNKTSKFCPYCELVIARQDELERIFVAACEEHAPEWIGNEYLVFGTMDREDWKAAQTAGLEPWEALELIYPFKDVWKFELPPAGWYYEKRGEDEKQPPG